MNFIIGDKTRVLKFGLEPLARLLANRSLLSAKCDPFTLSRGAVEIIRKSCSSIQDQTRQSLLSDQFRIIPIAESSKSIRFTKWDLQVRAKNIALEIRAGNNEDFFTIPETKFQSVVESGQKLAKKLGLKLKVVDFFHETETPDCGLIYEASTRGRTAAGKVRAAFAFVPEANCTISRGQAAEICKIFERGILGTAAGVPASTDEHSSERKAGIRERLLVKFRNYLIANSEI